MAAKNRGWIAFDRAVENTGPQFVRDAISMLSNGETALLGFAAGAPTTTSDSDQQDVLTCSDSCADTGIY